MSIILTIITSMAITYNIVLVGDSVSVSTGLPFDCSLENRLKENYDYQVSNFGSVGQSTAGIMQRILDKNHCAYIREPFDCLLYVSYYGHGGFHTFRLIRNRFPMKTIIFIPIWKAKDTKGYVRLVKTYKNQCKKYGVFFIDVRQLGLSVESIYVDDIHLTALCMKLISLEIYKIIESLK